MKLTIPNSRVKVKFLKTLPIHTIFLDPVTCYKYRVEERQHNGTLVKEANPYLGDGEGIEINVPADLLKAKNPKRFNIMSGMKEKITELKQKIQELETLNKQLLATCSPTDKMEIIQSKLGDKRYLETDENSYLLDNGLVVQLPKKRMKGEGGQIDGQEGGAVTCRQECEKLRDRIWREPDALAKLVKRQPKLQDRILEDLLHS